jgi:DMSO/TMAO reductase YedYZ molybdopterin-dependent catalytic subunit
MNSCRGTRGLSALVIAAVLLLSSCAPSVARTTPASVLPTPVAGDGVPTLLAPSPTLSETNPARPSPTPAALATSLAHPCAPSPIVAPTMAPNPGYAQLDPFTGLHVTGQVQNLDLATYRLRVTGKVENPLTLTYDELRCLPKVQASPVLTCPGFFVDKATWGGVPISEVLALARVQVGAEYVEFFSADAYRTVLHLAEAMDRSNFLAYEWEGQPLPRLHGFPLRVVLPMAEGNQWNKWVLEMQVK